MSMDYVHKGEAVKASTVNSIIEAIGGNQNMSPDLNVTTTAGGPQISMPSKYGGPNKKPDHILDVGRYQLSGWPMVKLQLGFKLDDCLGAFKYHRADGTTSTPSYAGVVYQNSENCPTGSELSGYSLTNDKFGSDAIAHSAGWVDTLIEDPYPSGVLEAQLWKYKSGGELAEVFTNVDDTTQVKGQLSTMLSNNGASQDDLNTLSLVDRWNLVRSSILSAGQDALIPTHEIVCKNGTIDVYETSTFDYNVVLKATLECIGVQKDGSGDVTSTKWSWKIPLGPDAEYVDGKARSSSVTYGGNQVVFEVAQGEIGSNFNGEATYNGKAIWYGSYEVQSNATLDACEVWLNMSYDYQVKATKGIFSSTKSSGSYTQDGILNRNVFIVKLSSFKPGANVAKGDRASVESIEYGTWGVLPKDGPKLDTYCQKDSATSFKSLDWANREGGQVECQCAELHDFDKLETIDPLSSDHLLIRRVDENNGAELKYISLSSLEISGMYVPPDADVAESQTSSLQTRELDNGTNVEELYNFHVPNTTEVQLSDLTNVDVVLRNPNNGQPFVEYGKLNIDIKPDAQGQTEQKSIDWLSSTHDLQLYNFDSGNSNINAKMWILGDLDSDKHGKVGKLIDPTSKDLLSVDILVRDNSTKQLKYMNLFVEPINVDTFSTNTKQKSLVYYKDKFQDRDYLSLKDFNTTPDTKLNATLSGNGLVDITGKNTWILTKKYNTANQMMELTYDKLQLSVDLSGVSADVRCDADVTLAQKSIQKKGDYIQLYNFTRPSITTKKTILNSLSATYDLLDTDDAVLVRSGSQLTYKKLQIETKLPSSGGGGGETSGYTGTKTQATNLKFNSNGQYKVELWGCDFQYENGLLKSIGSEKMIATLDTVGYSGA